MQITVNSQPLEVADDLSAACLIDLLKLSGKRLALEINLEIVPRGSFETRRLQAGDRVEIVHAIGGG
jgi:sulfur carrier protein